MCTIQSIKDAIQETCQTQYDMDSCETDQLLQSLPFDQEEDPLDRLLLPKRPYRPRKNTKNS